MRGTILVALASAVALCGAPDARAGVVAAEPYGFEISETVTIAAPPAGVWQALGRIGEWWSSAHTFSHDAHSLHLSLEPGGCLCEQFPGGGGARRMIVTYVEPGRTLRLDGAPGPMEAGAPSGHLTFSLAPAANGTVLSVTFEGGGFAKDGFDQWGPPLDRVLGEQAQRLRRYVESGHPD